MSGKTFLDTNIVVSTQVLSELANTLSRKFGLAFDVVAQAIVEVRDACTVIPVMPDTITQALTTEDMQHGQILDGVLTIRNPFGESIVS